MDDYTPSPDTTEYTHRIEDQREHYATITVSAFAKWGEKGSQLTPACLSVYTALVMRANYADKTCFPSLQTIADDAGVSRRVVTTALPLLRDAGLIRIRERKTDKGQSSNIYTILDPRQNLPGGSAKSAPGVVQNLHSPSAKSAPITNTIEQPPDERSIVPKQKAKRASRIEEPFGIDDATINWAFSEGFTFSDIAREKDKFVDYHASKGSTFVDWQRAFKNWLRNSRQFGQRTTPRTKSNFYKPNGGLTAEGMAAKARGEIQ